MLISNQLLYTSFIILGLYVQCTWLLLIYYPLYVLVVRLHGTNNYQY